MLKTPKNNMGHWEFIKYVWIPIMGLTISCQSPQKTALTEIPQNLIKASVKNEMDHRVRLGINQSIIIGVIDSSGIDVYASGAKDRISNKKPDQYTIYEIGSVTKVFTALLLGVKVKEGVVKLNDPIDKFLPDSLALSDTLGSVQLVQLASHSSGLRRQPTNLREGNYQAQNPYRHYDSKLLMKALRAEPLVNKPGETFQYSNFGAALLGYLLANQEGVSYEESLKKHILSPLGMHASSGYLKSDNEANGYAYTFPVSHWEFDAFAGAGALCSNVHDMLRFLSAQLGFSGPSLQPAIALSQDAYFPISEEGDVALGWGRYELENGDIFYRHNGGTGGFRSFVGYLSQSKQGVVVCTNSLEGVDDLGLHQLVDSFDLQTDKKTSIALHVSKKLEEEAKFSDSTSFTELFPYSPDSVNSDWGQLNYLGYTYLKHGETSKAIQTFSWNTELYPDNADGYDSLGDGYWEAKQYIEAKEAYEKTLALDPGYEHAREMLEKIKPLLKNP